MSTAVRRLRLVLVAAAALGVGLVLWQPWSGRHTADTPANPTSARTPPERSQESADPRMARLLREIARSAPERDPFSRSAGARRLREQVRRLPTSTPPRRRGELLQRLGREELRLGNAELAVEHYENAMAAFEGIELSEDLRSAARFEAGLAWLQLGERENCCAVHSAESCQFPVQDAGIHRHPRGSERAIHWFSKLIEDLPEDNRWRMAATWLLNVAYMTLGRWPDDVPEPLRLDPARFPEDETIRRMRNIAPALGVDALDTSGGAIVEDFNGDGRLDLMTSSWSPVEPMHYYERQADGRFVERTREAGLGSQLGGLNMTTADFDNDGDIDVYVLRGAWLRGEGHRPNSLLRNDGKGNFEDVTFELGLGDKHYPTQTAGWADYDLDGDLDLFVGNESTPGVVAPCQLFRNDGARFTDVAGQAGVLNHSFAKGVSWGDYDADGDPDLYVSNLGEANRLYRNNGDGTFTDVATRLGVDKPRRSFPAWFWDFDNDGVLDLYVPSYAATVAEVGAFFLGKHLPHEAGRLYRGDGRGGFEDVAEQVGLGQPVMPMGSNFADLDGDGYLDFYLGTGEPDFAAVVPSVLYFNREGNRFIERAAAAGMAHLQKGHAISFADLDHDGDLDVVAQMGGAWPGDRFQNALYENPGYGNAWIGLELEGTTSNRRGVGAHLELIVTTKSGGARSIHRHVGTGGSFGVNPHRQVIGLGPDAEVRELRIRWPGDGNRHVVRSLTTGTAWRVRQNDPRAIRLVLPEAPLEPRR